jgi:hypothetical protein
LHKSLSAGCASVATPFALPQVTWAVVAIEHDTDIPLIEFVHHQIVYP